MLAGDGQAAPSVLRLRCRAAQARQARRVRHELSGVSHVHAVMLHVHTLHDVLCCAASLEPLDMATTTHNRLRGMRDGLKQTKKKRLLAVLSTILLLLVVVQV